MKIAFVTDNHFDVSSRFEETIRIHDWIAEDADRRGCTLTLLGGDLHERKSVAAERNAVANWLTRMAELGPVVGVYGNHEVPLDLDIYNQLESEYPIRFHATPTVVVARDVQIQCLPWPRRAYLAAYAQAAGVDTEDLARVAMQDLLRGLGAQATEDDLPRVFLGHVQMRGSRVSTGQPLVGLPLELGLEDLSLCRSDFYALGHIHLGEGNEWKIGDAPVAYGGSPRRTSFGETETKSYTVIEFEGSKLVGWERVEVPATRMVHIDGKWLASELAITLPRPLEEYAVKGAEVRLRYHVASDERDAARRAAAELKSVIAGEGAAFVKVEETVEANVRARAPEIAAAKTLPEKLSHYWRARGIVVGDRESGLLTKLASLEEAAR